MSDEHDELAARRSSKESQPEPQATDTSAQIAAFKTFFGIDLQPIIDGMAIAVQAMIEALDAGRIAIVDLPEPSEPNELDDHLAAVWMQGDVVKVSRKGTIFDDNGLPVGPDEARNRAAMLLAAASYADRLRAAADGAQ